VTLAADLIARYKSEVPVDWAAAYVLYHPQAGYQYLVNGYEEIQGKFFGTLQTFLPIPISMVLPKIDDSGNASMSITMGNVGLEPIYFLDRAIVDGETPITCWYSVFIDGDVEPKIDPWIEFTMSNITANETAVTASATRADILNRRFPRIIYKVEEWPGLRRR